MEARGRGRCVGRSRPPQRPGAPQQPSRQGVPPQSGGVRPPPQVGGRSQPQPGGVRPPQAGGVRPQPPTWVKPVWPRPEAGAPQQQQPQAPPQTSSGRGSHQEQGAVPRSAPPQSVSGGGDAGNKAGSAVRGRMVNRSQVVFTRPATATTKKGSSGKPIALTANYLPLVDIGKWCLYQYRVDMDPDIDDTRARKGLVRTATREVITGGYLFDGTVLYTPQRFAAEQIELFAATEGGENIRITIRCVGDLTWGDYHYIQLFNLIIRKCLMLMGLQQVGRHYYLPENRIRMKDYNVQLWPGYFTSMRQHEKSILLNVDLQFKFLRMDTVYDMLMECQGAHAKKEFQAKVIGTIVLTNYNNKTYRIDDVDFNISPSSTFKKPDGSEITFREYYEVKYSVRICDLRQPLLISRCKAREIRAGMDETVILVPELCNMTGLTDRQRDNFHLMKALDQHTRVDAAGRIQKLTEFAQQLHRRPEVVEEIRRWDLTIADSLIKFQGRRLPLEGIVAGGNSRFHADHTMEWTRELRGKPMLNTQPMQRMAVITPSKFRDQTTEFVGLLVKAARGMHWDIGIPKIFEIRDDRVGTYLDELERLINSASPTLIMVVLQSKSADKYSAIKKKCSVDRAVPTQVVISKNLTSKGAMSIATKVAIQLNSKIGGAPWSVAMPLTNVMVVGYDVCRDTVNKKKSFAGIVASMDKGITRYFNQTVEHTMEEELSNNFALFMVLACKKYKEFNGVFPERILIYRDGVGEGQLPYVFSHEVVEIKTKLKQEIYKDTDLKMAFIVVNKRINTKIFADGDNPPAGTVVDDVITLPERYDFYIVSQCVKQGTVAPTSYNVLEDTFGLNADRLQILTYKMTHLYYNWSGTIRVPAPCQYAHKLAFQTSQNLHRPAHSELETLLYFI